MITSNSTKKHLGKYPCTEAPVHNENETWVNLAGHVLSL